MVNNVYLLLGSNLGDRQDNLTQAALQLNKLAGQVVEQSRIYETLAWGVEQQPSYLNQVLKIQTELFPEELLQVINQLEANMGRERRIRWESRIIDIDILYYDTIIWQSQTLIIPHPELANRRFTLVPLAEIAPGFIHPILKLSTRDLLKMCPDNLNVTPIQSI
jgi:2-amino-4-hydroxy-6-hydroxymethyldihydropteridine diphosphokinase